mmetsp:Transcript_61071/g.126016  ORF Transcript_61071/g.126016 Transcript_61071/m.126016 type:complete len:273 (-) Transcript_61071:1796-2614(-)
MGSCQGRRSTRTRRLRRQRLPSLPLRSRSQRRRTQLLHQCPLLLHPPPLLWRSLPQSPPQHQGPLRRLLLSPLSLPRRLPPPQPREPPLLLQALSHPPQPLRHPWRPLLGGSSPLQSWFASPSSSLQQLGTPLLLPLPQRQRLLQQVVQGDGERLISFGRLSPPSRWPLGRPRQLRWLLLVDWLQSFLQLPPFFVQPTIPMTFQTQPSRAWCMSPRRASSVSSTSLGASSSPSLPSTSPIWPSGTASPRPASQLPIRDLFPLKAWMPTSSSS